MSIFEREKISLRFIKVINFSCNPGFWGLAGGRLKELKIRSTIRLWLIGLAINNITRRNKKKKQAGLSRATLEISSEFSSNFSLRTYKLLKFKI